MTNADPERADEAWYVSGAESVLERCRRYDNEAWSLVHGAAYSLAVVQCRTEEDLSPDDIAQAVTSRLITNLGRVASEQAFLTYIKRTTVNLILDARRRAARGPSRVGMDSIVEPESDDDPSARLRSWSMGRYKRDQFLVAWRELDAKCQSALEMYYTEKILKGSTWEELGRKAGRPWKTVASIVNRCNRSLWNHPAMQQFIRGETA